MFNLKKLAVMVSVFLTTIGFVNAEDADIYTCDSLLIRGAEKTSHAGKRMFSLL